ncbi:M48 family metallopeptidase [Candidatus Pacearchaeota archaeon]|nr:M48 family metallopeptidase [Candidatus Pacearchaeota archaeon]
MNVQLNHQGFDLSVRRSMRARRLRLQINSNGEFQLVIPWLTTQRAVDRFLKENQSWIDRQITSIEKQKAKRPTVQYGTGDLFYYFGEKVKLAVQPSDRKRSNLRVQEDQMVISLYRHVGKKDGKIAVKKVIEQFYRKKAEEVIHDRLQFFNEHYQFRYNRVTLRNQKTRWGSCSSRGNLNFNWRLIMAPIEVIDYVVAHELCHLKEMNHSSRYWALVEQAIPDYKKYRKWLKDNHYLLTF